MTIKQRSEYPDWITNKLIPEINKYLSELSSNGNQLHDFYNRGYPIWFDEILNSLNIYSHREIKYPIGISIGEYPDWCNNIFIKELNRVMV